MKDDSTSATPMLSIALNQGAYNPLGCTMCGRVFANYSSWCDRMNHSCASYTQASPVNVDAVDPHAGGTTE